MSQCCLGIKNRHMLKGYRDRSSDKEKKKG